MTRDEVFRQARQTIGSYAAKDIILNAMYKDARKDTDVQPSIAGHYCRGDNTVNILTGICTRHIENHWYDDEEAAKAALEDFNTSVTHGLDFLANEIPVDAWINSAVRTSFLENFSRWSKCFKIGDSYKRTIRSVDGVRVFRKDLKESLRLNGKSWQDFTLKMVNEFPNVRAVTSFSLAFRKVRTDPTVTDCYKLNSNSLAPTTLVWLARQTMLGDASEIILNGNEIHLKKLTAKVDIRDKARFFAERMLQELKHNTSELRHLLVNFDRVVEIGAQQKGKLAGGADPCKRFQNLLDTDTFVPWEMSTAFKMAGILHGIDTTCTTTSDILDDQIEILQNMIDAIKASKDVYQNELDLYVNAGHLQKDYAYNYKFYSDTGAFTLYVLKELLENEERCCTLSMFSGATGLYNGCLVTLGMLATEYMGIKASYTGFYDEVVKAITKIAR